MTTVLAAAGARCDRACYEATCPDCTCVCGGRLHGVGRARAVELAPELVDGGVVAVLELPLDACGELRCARRPGQLGGSGSVEVVNEPRCVRCRRTEAEAGRLLRYLDGPWCTACAAAALELRE